MNKNKLINAYNNSYFKKANKQIKLLTNSIPIQILTSKQIMASELCGAFKRASLCTYDDIMVYTNTINWFIRRQFVYKMAIHQDYFP